MESFDLRVWGSPILIALILNSNQINDWTNLKCEWFFVNIMSCFWWLAHRSGRTEESPIVLARAWLDWKPWDMSAWDCVKAFTFWRICCSPASLSSSPLISFMFVLSRDSVTKRREHCQWHVIPHQHNNNYTILSTFSKTDTFETSPKLSPIENYSCREASKNSVGTSETAISAFGRCPPCLYNGTLLM